MRLIPHSLRKKIKQIIYNRLGFLNVTRPYQINLLKEGRFKNKVVLVTGGSGAIGRAICCRFAIEGAIVYVAGTTLAKINMVVDEIHQLGGEAFPCIVNVKEYKSIEDSFQSIVNRHQRIDFLVTCAGGSARDEQRDIHEQDPEVIENIITTNLIGTILCVQQAAKYMIRQKNGKIITLSSTIGAKGKAGYSEYAAAKSGIFAFVKSSAMELGKYGINVNCVTPGIVQRDKITNIQLEYIKTTNYLNSYGKPEDISNMVAFLASDEADFITGQNFIIDGGRTLGLKGD